MLRATWISSTTMLVVLLISLALSLAGCGRGGDAGTFVTGTVTYRERVALPPDAVVEVSIEDVSRADAPAPKLGTVRIDKPGSPPIAFRVPYDPKQIDARHRYNARARILVGDKVWFASDTAIPVLTQGNGNQVEILVRQVQASGDLGVLPAAFAGQLPCADCSGIDYLLVLHADHSYYLRMSSASRSGTNEIDDIGRWTIEGDQSTLSLHGSREAPMHFAIVSPDRLRKLDPGGRAIQSALPHEITRTAQFVSFEPRLVMRGMYRYYADAAAFRECTTGRRFPVAQEAANVSLERAYGEARQPQGAEVLITLEGILAERPRMEGQGTETALVPQKVIAVNPGGSCGAAAAGAAPARGDGPPLEGTRWVLTHLAGEPIQVREPAQRPSLVLESETGRVAAFGGCNNMNGAYALTGNGLRFSGVASTMKACPDMQVENAFNAAMGRVVSWKIQERTLELADGNGDPLMRFEARPTP